MYKNLIETRKKIEQIDLQLLELIKERADLCIDTLSYKMAINAEIYAPNIEKDKINKICKANTSKLSDISIKNIFQLIIQQCRELQIENQKNKR